MLKVGFCNLFIRIYHDFEGGSRDISGPKYEWAMKIGQWPMSHSFACKNQDFDRPFEILICHLEKMMGTRNLNIHFTAK